MSTSMPINKAKYNQYLTLKADPALALMKMMQEYEKEISDYMAKCEKEMEIMMEEKMAKMGQKEPMHADFIQKIVNQAVAQVIGNSKGDKGDTVIGPDGPPGPKGDKGESIIGPQGEQGPEGPQGKQGKDGIGKNGLDGKTPIFGIDYFMEKDKQTFMEKIKESLKIGEILDKLNELQKIIANLDRNQKLGGQKTIHRGGMKFYGGYSIGTGDGNTKVFTLPSAPYDVSQVLVHIGAATLTAISANFSISGTVLTLVDAAPNGENVAITMQAT